MKDTAEYTYQGHLVMFPSGWGMYDLFGRNGAIAGRRRSQRPRRSASSTTGTTWRSSPRATASASRSTARPSSTGATRSPSCIKEGPIGLQLHSNNVPQEIHFKGLVLTTFPEEDKLITVK